jgi:hypothetical protein
MDTPGGDIPLTVGRSTASGCYTTSVSALLFLIWIPALAFETILCLLMLYKAWRKYKEDQRSPLLDLLLRDRCVASRPSRMHQLSCSEIVFYTSQRESRLF